MKRMAYGVLAFLVCGSPGWSQRRFDDSNKTRQMAPSATDTSRLQWLVLSGEVATSPAGSADPAPGGTVSVATLRVPESAAKEMQKFVKDFDAGKLNDSVKHLSKAIEIYPGWSAAHHNLGQTYARMGEYEKAVAEFQTAAELDTRGVRSWLSLSNVYFLQKKYAEGETAARRALALDPVNSDARYILSRNLVSGGKVTPEAEQLLRKSKEQYPVARLVLANLLLQRRAVAEAVSELRGYLAQPEAEGKERVSCMVRRLTEPEGTVSCSMQ